MDQQRRIDHLHVSLYDKSWLLWLYNAWNAPKRLQLPTFFACCFALYSIVHLSVMCNRKHGVVSYAPWQCMRNRSSEFFRQNDHKQSIAGNTTIALVHFSSCYSFLHPGSSRTYCKMFFHCNEKMVAERDKYQSDYNAISD